MKLLCRILLMLAVVLPAKGQDSLGYHVLDMRHGLSESRVRQIRQMPDGRIAIATTATVDVFDGTRFVSYKLPPEAACPLPLYRGQRHLACDTLGYVWLRNKRTLYVVDTRRGEVVKDVGSLMEQLGLTAAQVAAWPVAGMPAHLPKDATAYERDRYGGEWIGTKERGILYRNLMRHNQFHTYADSAFTFARRPNFCSSRASQISAKYAPSATNCTLDDGGDYLYLGTRKGLMVVDGKDRLVTTLDEQDGLSTNNVQGIIRDDQGTVWIATANGISRIRVAGRDSFDIVNYGWLDGISVGGREFRTCQIHRDTTGRITVGFVGGICTFHPDSVKAPRYTFHYPRPAYAARQNEAGRNALLVLSAGLLALALLAVAYILWRKKRQAKDSGKISYGQDTPKPVSAGQADSKIADKLKDGAAAMLSPNDQFLAKLQESIEQNIGNEDFSVQQLSELMAMDRTVLYRRMQQITQTSPSAYIRNIRMNVAARLLKETQLPVSDIARQTGFSSTKYFSASFKTAFGQSPKEYRMGD